MLGKQRGTNDSHTLGIDSIFTMAQAAARSVGSSAAQLQFLRSQSRVRSTTVPSEGEVEPSLWKNQITLTLFAVSEKSLNVHGKQSVYWTVDDQNKAQVPDVDEEILSMGQSAETRKRRFGGCERRRKAHVFADRHWGDL